jgi:hypothetical protein
LEHVLLSGLPDTVHETPRLTRTGQIIGRPRKGWFTMSFVIPLVFLIVGLALFADTLMRPNPSVDSFPRFDAPKRPVQRLVFLIAGLTLTLGSLGWIFLHATT